MICLGLDLCLFLGYSQSIYEIYTERRNLMSNQETLTWQPGTTEETPLPPLVDPRALTGQDNLFLQPYRKLAPGFRLPRPRKPPTVLAAPEANPVMPPREAA